MGHATLNDKQLFNQKVLKQQEATNSYKDPKLSASKENSE